MSLWENFHNFVFDFSEGQAEGRRVERMVRVALAETTTDSEFRDLLYHMLQTDDYLKTEYRWALMQWQMAEYCGFRDDWRAAGRRLIDFLPKFYKYKSDWDGD